MIRNYNLVEKERPSSSIPLRKWSTSLQLATWEFSCRSLSSKKRRTADLFPVGLSRVQSRFSWKKWSSLTGCGPFSGHLTHLP